MALAAVGRELSLEDMAALVGAPNGSQVQAVAMGNHIDIETSHEAFAGHLRRTLGRDEEGRLFLENKTFYLRAGKTGLGTAVFAHQVDAARRLGIDYIKAEAVSPMFHKENGYYVWPRLGFNGPLDGATRASLPPQLAHARDLLDLMQTPEGRAWWKQQGRSVYVRFELDKNSKSSRHLEHYLDKKGPRAGAVQKLFAQPVVKPGNHTDRIVSRPRSANEVQVVVDLPFLSDPERIRSLVRPSTTHDLAILTGASPGSIVVVGRHDDHEDSKGEVAAIDVLHGEDDRIRHFVDEERVGSRRMLEFTLTHYDNSSFNARPPSDGRVSMISLENSPRAFLSDVQYRAQAAKRLGFSKLTIDYFLGPKDVAKMQLLVSGGFDQLIEPDVTERLPASLKSVRRVSELMRTKEGRQWMAEAQFRSDQYWTMDLTTLPAHSVVESTGLTTLRNVSTS